ncbi:MAG TPA: hypothetical protein ENN42_02280 [Thioalkalivibrio sp.]|nr:hypothetical protein [Thioalkalivibrio sp.]
MAIESVAPLPWLVLLPLAWATLSFLLGPSRGAGIAIVGLLLQAGLVLLLAWQLTTMGTQHHAVGGWGAPLGIDLVADGLSVVMLLMTAAVALPVAIYARAWFVAKPAGAAWFWPLSGFLVAALNGLFLSADLFNIYVTLELLGLAAVGLTAATGERRAVAAAMRYLLATLLGSGAYLMGVALVYGTYGSVSLAVLGGLVESLPVVMLAAGLMVAGMLLKTALFPLHFWLPPAHGGAATPVSALLSALVIKASFYLALRLWFGVFEPLAAVSAAQVLGALGAAAVFWGSVQALLQARLKMLVAYSTVAQVGYLFLVFPLATGTPAEAAAGAWQGGVLQAVAHALAKAAMFAAAGAMILGAGSDRIDRLGGVGARLPLALFAFGLAGIVLMGLPPTGGFATKWLLLMAALETGQWWWAAVLVGGGLLAAAYVFRVLLAAFAPVPEQGRVTGVARSLEWTAFALATAGVLLGLFAAHVVTLLDVGA